MSTVSLVQIGVGGVGAELVKLIAAHAERWAVTQGIKLRYVALVDTSGAIFESNGLSSDQIMDVLSFKADGGRFGEMPGGIVAEPREVMNQLPDTGQTIVVDCAAGDGTWSAARDAVERNWDVVLSNKAPLSVDQERFDSLFEAGKGHVWYEATVGAGLPVIATLRSLLDTGDILLKVEGCLSGTLGLIASKLSEGLPYSQAVLEAKRLGYTEPDPRDDLSGLDVARKALILARTAGRRLDLSDIVVEPLMEQQLSTLPLDDFMSNLPDSDAHFSELAEQARHREGVLRYLAEVPVEGGIAVGLSTVPADSQVGSLSGPDNIVVFSTEVYREHPLTIIGPGAGTRSTAMGVLSDVLQAVKR